MATWLLRTKNTTWKSIIKYITILRVHVNLDIRVQLYEQYNQKLKKKTKNQTTTPHALLPDKILVFFN